MAGTPATGTPPHWLKLAEVEIGQREMRGGENPRIVDYFTATTYHAREDEVPWCAAFVCWVLQQAGIPSPRSAAAKAFLPWGRILHTPKPGAIVVIRRRDGQADGRATGSASGYHVGFYLSRTPESVTILGGNQSDTVKVSTFPTSRYIVVGYRWPVHE